MWQATSVLVRDLARHLITSLSLQPASRCKINSSFKTYQNSLYGSDVIHFLYF